MKQWTSSAESGGPGVSVPAVPNALTFSSVVQQPPAPLMEVGQYSGGPGHLQVPHPHAAQQASAQVGGEGAWNLVGPDARPVRHKDRLRGASPKRGAYEMEVSADR